MLGLPCEEWKWSQHMLTDPPRGYAIVTAAADGSSPSSSLHSANSFIKVPFRFHIKDGRKISVGDCALFKPPQDCPPFIGIIRLLSVGEDNKLNLGVNWLYRPTELKLGEGVLLEATPNEIFYFFHKDEIPAASLLHPCRVAFLPKGVDLPSATSSLVCWRVYDTTNKCLWWLTDQDYINEHQKEVNHLLHKTQVEMHATGEPVGRSPKPTNSTSSASSFLAGSDTVHNSTPSILSQVKGKKRERVDQGIEQGKRECTIKTDDGDSGPSRQGRILKVELAEITDKGGLVDSEGVAKLVQLMVPDKREKLDLACRSILAGVIAATDKYDCLSQFVQLRGLLVFDEWLQEVHKVKIRDLAGPKDSVKLVEKFLLVLLRSLDKLPINLQALQMCNIGKSVNHLRSHKNMEIQKKARGLVDTWKKCVEAEMTITDAKSGLNQTVTWPIRTRLLEFSQGGNRQSGIASEVAVRCSGSQLSASNTVSSKTVQAEDTSRLSSAPASSLNSLKLLLPATSAEANVEEWQLRSANMVGASDIPLATIKDDKSSGPRNSHNMSHSFSFEQTTVTANKTSAGLSLHQKQSNEFSVMNPSGVLKEAGTTKFSVKKNTTSDKLSQPGVTYEKVREGAAFEGNSIKLIVRIPNHGQNPAQDASSSFPDDPSLVKSRVPSPVLLETANLSDHSLKDKIDLRSDISGTDEVDESPAVISNDFEKIVEGAKAALSTFGNEEKASSQQDASFSSLNALIESCVKYSEPNTTLSAVDDTGMNLLASVAAGEVCKSYLATPIRSPQRESIIAEESGLGNNAEAKYPNDGIQDRNHPSDSDDNKNNKSDEVCQDLGATNVDGKCAALASEEKPAGQKEEHGSNPSQQLQQTKEDYLDGQDTVDEKLVDTLPVLAGGLTDEITRGEGGGQLCETKVVGNIEAGDNMEVDVKDTKCSIERLNSGSKTELKSPTELQFQSTQGGDEHVSCNSYHEMGKMRDEVEWKAEKSANYNTRTHVAKAEIHEPGQEENTVVSTKSGVLRTLASGVPGLDAEFAVDNLTKKVADDQLDGQILRNDVPAHQSMESEQEVGSKESKMTAMEAQEAEECSSTTADASCRSATRISDGDGKAEFDLNEGLNADDGKCLDMNSTSTLGCSNPVQLIIPVPVLASGISNCVSVPITVAAAAKGPSLPPVDLLKNKVEPGWKAPAATSAFRPAEPRKVKETSLLSSSMPLSDARAGKRSRPLLDIDLNVADERMLGDVPSQSFTLKDDAVPLPKDFHEPADDKVSTSGPGWCSGRIDLDLNQADGTPELGHCLPSSVPAMQSKPSSDGLLNCGMNFHRYFDLNDGPAIDEGNVDPLVYNQQSKIIVPSPPPIPGIRMNNSEMGNLSSWFPSAGIINLPITLPSIMSDRGDQPFTACGQQILSSSPAVPFHVGPNVQLASTLLTGVSANYADPPSGGRLSFHTANPQLLGTTFSSHYPRPDVCIPKGSNSNGSESSRKWASEGLDLNAGTWGSDAEGRQLTVGSSHALAEENARMFQMSGSILKRKEPERSWDGFKQSSWQ